MRIRPGFLAAAMLLISAAVIALLEWNSSLRDFSNTALLARMPASGGASVYLDVKKLRDTGVLDLIAGQRGNEDPDYLAFVKKTGFDYREHLDTLFAHFGADFQLYIVRGSINWDQVGGYLKSHTTDVRCVNGVCSIPVSRGRYLSAMPLAAGIMAMGVGPNRTVVYSAQEPRIGAAAKLPDAPFWIELSKEFVDGNQQLPEGSKAFLSALRGASNVFLSVTPGGARLEARLKAEFPAAADAESRKAQLDQARDTLRKFFERDKQKPEESDLASSLLAGEFDSQGTTLNGRWPLPYSLFLKLLGSGD